MHLGHSGPGPGSGAKSMVLRSAEGDNSPVLPLKQNPSCKHECCTFIAAERLRKRCQRRGGVGVVCVSEIGEVLHIALGCNTEEGPKKGKYSVCTGGARSVDGDCFVRTACRELKEEFKFIEPDQNLVRSFHQFFLHNGTPFFVLALPVIDVEGMNIRMAAANRDPSVPAHLKEMDHVALVPIKNYGRKVTIESVDRGIIGVDKLTGDIINFLADRSFHILR